MQIIVLPMCGIINCAYDVCTVKIHSLDHICKSNYGPHKWSRESCVAPDADPNGIVAAQIHHGSVLTELPRRAKAAQIH